MSDRETIRTLAEQIAQAAALPIQEERRQLWTANNDLKPIRPMVWMTEIPFGEFRNKVEPLTPQCEDPALKGLESHMREVLFIEKHLHTDRVIENYWSVGMVIKDRNHFGIEVQEEIVDLKQGSDIVSHHYEPVIKEEEDIEKIKDPQPTYDEKATLERRNLLNDLFGDILPIRIDGVKQHAFTCWDILVKWTGISEGLLDLAMRPEYVHQALRRLTDAVLARERALADLGVLDGPHPNERVGSGANGYTNDLPSEPGPEGWQIKDHWGFATSQIFSEVSPDMHKEFALDYERELLDQCGLSYYGCCEPLHHKMHLLATLPNLRKVSISPWCNTIKAYENAQKKYVFSHKPNPAIFASDHFHLEAARKEVQHRLEASNDMPCELVPKDISTCRGDVQRLIDWTKMAMEEARARETVPV